MRKIFITVGLSCLITIVIILFIEKNDLAWISFSALCCFIGIDATGGKK